MSDNAPLNSATRKIRPELAQRLRELKTGERIRITQTVRVGSTKTWTTVVEGTFRDLKYLQTGLATDRVAKDDIIVVTVHFTKDNGELSAISLDEKSEVEVIG